MSRTQDVLSDLLAVADIHLNGSRPWDIAVHNDRFFGGVLASGSLGFNESYMYAWWDCEALDEMCCRAIRAQLDQHFALRLPNVWTFLSALLVNQQTIRRSRKVGRIHYDLAMICSKRCSIHACNIRALYSTKAMIWPPPRFGS